MIDSFCFLIASVKQLYSLNFYVALLMISFMPSWSFLSRLLISVSAIFSIGLGSTFLGIWVKNLAIEGLFLYLSASSSAAILSFSFFSSSLSLYFSNFSAFSRSIFSYLSRFSFSNLASLAAFSTSNRSDFSFLSFSSASCLSFFSLSNDSSLYYLSYFSRSNLSALSFFSASFLAKAMALYYSWNSLSCSLCCCLPASMRYFSCLSCCLLNSSCYYCISFWIWSSYFWYSDCNFGKSFSFLILSINASTRSRILALVDILLFLDFSAWISFYLAAVKYKDKLHVNSQLWRAYRLSSSSPMSPFSLNYFKP